MQLTCTQTKDTANNKSIITWVLSSIGGNNEYYSTGPTAIYINGANVYYKDRVNWEAKVFPAAKGSVSGTTEVAHTDDGSKTITIQLRTIIYYGASSLKVYTQNWELDTIARGVSILSAPATFSDIDGLPTVTYANPMGNNIKTLEMCIKDSSGWSVIAPYRAVNKTGTLSYTFTNDDIEALRTLTAGTWSCGGMFFLKGTTADGTEYTDSRPFTFSLTENPDTKPTVTMTIAPSNPDTFPSALASTYVQGKSGVKATITGEGKYGGSISSYALAVGGVNKNSSSNVVTSEAIKSSGNVTVIGSAFDSRGFMGTASQTISVLEYSKPLVIPRGSDTAIQCYRSDGNGKRVGNSTSVWIKAKRSYHNLGGKNGCTLEWRSRKSTETWDTTHKWSTLVANTNTSTEEYNALVSGTFDLTKSYAIQIRAIDDVGEYDIKDFEIPTQDVALHLGHGGKNVSIGEFCDYAEQYTFHSSWKAIFDNGIHGSIYPEEASGDLLEYALSCQRGFVPFYTNINTTNIPTNGGYAYAVGFVLTRKDGEGANRQVSIFLMEPATGAFAINNYHYESGGWQGWKYHTPHN